VIHKNRIGDEPLTFDMTGDDYAYDPRDPEGLTGHIATWNNLHPRVGDFLILKNGMLTTRYVVKTVDHCMNVDPPTMWMADLEFAPRS
jgi:hypothetical protein